MVALECLGLTRPIHPAHLLAMTTIIANIPHPHQDGLGEASLHKQDDGQMAGLALAGMSGMGRISRPVLSGSCGIFHPLNYARACTKASSESPTDSPIKKRGSSR